MKEKFIKNSNKVQLQKVDSTTVTTSTKFVGLLPSLLKCKLKDYKRNTQLKLAYYSMRPELSYVEEYT